MKYLTILFSLLLSTFLNAQEIDGTYIFEYEITITQDYDYAKEKYLKKNLPPNKTSLDTSFTGGGSDYLIFETNDSMRFLYTKPSVYSHPAQGTYTLGDWIENEDTVSFHNRLILRYTSEPEYEFGNYSHEKTTVEYVVGLGDDNSLMLVSSETCWETGAYHTFYTFYREAGIDDKINIWFTPIAKTWGGIVLYPIHFKASLNYFGFGKSPELYSWFEETGEDLNKSGDSFIEIPIVLLLLIFGALFFTIRFSFVNIRHFPTAINTVRGKYDELENGTEKTDLAVDGDIKDTIKDESKEGEVSHFQALTTAVSGTVGLGNIAGVALAITLGGPGATFWMIICGLIGMSTKFVECTLGVKYRDVGKDGTVYGGPMYYLSKGLKEGGYVKLGKILAVIFAILCIGASFGGGNAAQSNQAALQIANMFGMEGGNTGTIIGIFLAFIVGVVIIGGIKRIASVTEKVVPFMAIIYVSACLFIIFSNFSEIGWAFGQIFSKAFSLEAGFGGLMGVLIVGFQRAAFSNEAGAGSAAIAHSAVKTKYPASEGVVALLEPFIDTVVICTMTALVIILFNGDDTVFKYGSDFIMDGKKVEGAVLTSMAFEDAIPWFPIVLTIAIILFAISTMISWSYYGLQSWMYLFGKSKISDLAYKILFLLFIVIGAAANMDAVWGFSDAMILALIFPNMIGLFFLFPVVKKELAKYLDAIRNK